MDRVWHVSAHRNLPLVGACGSDGRIRIYSLPDLKLKATLQSSNSRSVRSVAWRPVSAENSPTIASACFDGKTSIWTLEGAEAGPTGGWEFVAQLEGHDNEVKSVAWSQDGQFLATCARDKSVWIWEVDPDAEDFDCVAVLQDHTQDVKHVSWHPREELLASSSYDQSVRLWQHSDDEWVCVTDIQGNAGTVWCSSFESIASPIEPEPYFTSHDDCSGFNAGKARLATSSADGVVRVYTRLSRSIDDPSTARSAWQLPTQDWSAKPIELPTKHNGAAYSVKWLNTGEIASVGADGQVLLHVENDSGEWELAYRIEKAHGCYEINSVDAIGDMLLTAGDDGCVRVWCEGKLNSVIEYSDLYRPETEPVAEQQAMEFEITL